jgi:hypothetical protein
VDRSWEYINRSHVEIGAEAAQFPEKEYINGIAVAVYGNLKSENSQHRGHCDSQTMPRNLNKIVRS